MDGADSNCNRNSVRLRDVLYLDGGVVREFRCKDGCDTYFGRGFRSKCRWWIEPGTVVILETDGDTGPVDPAPVPGLVLAPYVENGQMVGIVCAEDGVLLKRGMPVARVSQPAVQEVA